MTDLNTLLKNGDPVREDEGLSPVDAKRMRRVVVAATLEPSPSRTPWLRPFAFTAVGALVVIVAAIAGDRAIVRQAWTPAPIDPSTTLGEGAGGGERRQLQFSTPGGTRIIWIFDQNLRLQESMP
jgi:hypothetical protein